MKIFPFKSMTRLEWDQSFLEYFAPYKNLMLFDKTITFNEKSLSTYENILDKDAMPQEDFISYVNSSVNIDSNPLQFLLCQVEKKQKGRIVDNSYSASSHSPPLIKDQANFPLHVIPKSTKFFQNESLQEKDLFSKSSQIIAHASNTPRKTEKFLLPGMVERYGLARLLNSHPSYSSRELQKMRTNLIHLIESGFYFGMISAVESRQLLRNSKVGTFFLRDSSNPGHVLSLSVVTRRGTTSIRIHFRDALFGLDTNSENTPAPSFDSVLHLVQYYVEHPYKNVLVESSGRCDTPVVLKRPFIIDVPRLSHLARLKINSCLRGHSVDKLCLIPSLKLFLQQYTFSV